MSSQVHAQPYTGTLVIDVTKLAKILIDLPPNGLTNLRVAKAGIEAVVDELASHVASDGAAAGIPLDVYDHFVTCSTNIAQIRSVRAAVAKLAEVLVESEAKYAHERENDIGIIVDTAQSTALAQGHPRDPCALREDHRLPGAVGREGREDPAAERRGPRASLFQAQLSDRLNYGCQVHGRLAARRPAGDLADVPGLDRGAARRGRTRTARPCNEARVPPGIRASLYLPLAAPTRSRRYTPPLTRAHHSR